MCVHVRGLEGQSTTCTEQLCTEDQHKVNDRQDVERVRHSGRKVRTE